MSNMRVMLCLSTVADAACTWLCRVMPGTFIWGLFQLLWGQSKFSMGILGPTEASLRTVPTLCLYSNCKRDQRSLKMNK